MSQVQEVTRARVPYWIVGAGGKYDFSDGLLLSE